MQNTSIIPSPHIFLYVLWGVLTEDQGEFFPVITQPSRSNRIRKNPVKYKYAHFFSCKLFNLIYHFKMISTQ